MCRLWRHDRPAEGAAARGVVGEGSGPIVDEAEDHPKEQRGEAAADKVTDGECDSPGPWRLDGWEGVGGRGPELAHEAGDDHGESDQDQACDLVGEDLNSRVAGGLYFVVFLGKFFAPGSAAWEDALGNPFVPGSVAPPGIENESLEQDGGDGEGDGETSEALIERIVMPEQQRHAEPLEQPGGDDADEHREDEEEEEVAEEAEEDGVEKEMTDEFGPSSHGAPRGVGGSEERRGYGNDRMSGEAIDSGLINSRAKFGVCKCGDAIANGPVEMLALTVDYFASAGVVFESRSGQRS